MKDDKIFYEKKILLTGGTGSLGNALTERLLAERYPPRKIVIFSRDEAKQHAMRLRFQNLGVSTDEVIYSNFLKRVVFVIGDIRDKSSVIEAIRGVDIIFNVAALKQVPTAEYFPVEALKTNVIGSSNLVSSIIESGEPVDLVLGTSTDKACHPVNAYGMTKALMEKIFISANVRCDSTKFILTRYGNVMGSTGSVLPLFKNQIENNKPLTVTSTDMTRYMMSLDQSVDTIFHACKFANRGDIVVPIIPSAKIIDVAEVMSAGTDSKIEITGTRPGEKIHEILISKEEKPFTSVGKDYFTISSMLPELNKKPVKSLDATEYSSDYNIMSKDQILDLLRSQGYMP